MANENDSEQTTETTNDFLAAIKDIAAGQTKTNEAITQLAASHKEADTKIEALTTQLQTLATKVEAADSDDSDSDEDGDGNGETNAGGNHEDMSSEVKALAAALEELKSSLAATQTPPPATPEPPTTPVPTVLAGMVDSPVFTDYLAAASKGGHAAGDAAIMEKYMAGGYANMSVPADRARVYVTGGAV